MSQSQPSENLNPFEARLAQLTPRSAHINRDEILFQAGRHAAVRDHRRVTHRWCAACAVLACMVGGQWIWLADRASHSEAPVIADRQPTAEGPVNAPPPSKSATDIDAQRKAASPVGESILADTNATHPEQKPSLWAQLFPQPLKDLTTPAVAQELSVGSSVHGTLAQAFTPPKPGRMPSQDRLPLLLMRHAGTPE